MTSLGTPYLILFGLTALLAFVFPLIKDGVFKNLSFKPILSSLLPFVAVMLPFCGMFVLASSVLPINQYLPCFAGAAVLSFVLSRVGLPGHMRGILLLVASIVFTSAVSVEGSPVLMLATTMLGLLVTKVTDSLLIGEDRSVDDILPPLIWLTTVAWAQSIDNQSIAQEREAIILSIMSVAQFLRIMQRPFTKEDRVFIKRVVLATSGGLGVLLVLTKLVMDNDMQPLALLCGGGMFATYLFQNMDKEGQNTVRGTTAVKLLIVIGMLAMVASRFFGFFGYLALASCALVAPWPSITQFAGLFFCVRVLLQLFISSYNANVTGINIEHAYVGAAQYAGFVVVACLAMLLREIKDRRLLVTLFLAAGVLCPMGANYYLHAEPASSMLVACTVAAVIFAVLAPAFMQGETVGYENLLFMPAMMATVGVVFNCLLAAGNEATNEYRTQVLAYALGGLILVVLAGWAVNKFVRAKKSAVAVAPTE